MIAYYADIADTAAVGHIYEISFEFKAAFNKVPHNLFLEALSNMGVSGTPLRWFSMRSVTTSQRGRLYTGDKPNTVESNSRIYVPARFVHPPYGLSS